MLTDRQAIDVAFEKDTEKRLKMIDALSEEEAKSLLRKLTYHLNGDRWKEPSPFDRLS